MCSRTMTGNNIRNIEIRIDSEKFRSGTSTGLRLIPTAASGDEEDQEWIDLAETTINTLRTGAGVKHRLDDEGDHLTLGDLLDRNDLTVDELEHTRHIRNIDPETEYEVGDVVEISTLHNGDPRDPKQGVVTPYDGDGVKLLYESGGWDILENDGEKLRAGRYAMGLGLATVYDIQPAETVSDEIEEKRAEVLEDADLDERAADYDVDVQKSWESSNGESERASDLHARVEVTGPGLSEPAIVRCNNLFDFGWTANIETDVDDDLREVIVRATRKNSPIPTNPRL